MVQLEKMAKEDLASIESLGVPCPNPELFIAAWRYGWLFAADMYVNDPKAFPAKVIQILDEVTHAGHATYRD